MRSGVMCPQPASEAAESGRGPKGSVLFRRHLWLKDRPGQGLGAGTLCPVISWEQLKALPRQAPPIPPPLQTGPREPQPSFLK